MLTLLFVIYLMLFSSMIDFAGAHGYATIKNLLLFFTLFGAGIFVSKLIENIISLFHKRDVITEITSYSEVNRTIEEWLRYLMKYCADWDCEIIDNLCGEALINFTDNFPELRSNTIVQSKIKAWRSNHTQIKKLKKLQAKASACKWLLYFGR